MLQDPDNATFDTTAVQRMIAMAWADIDDIAPRRFQEDITPVADTLVYQVLEADFPDPNDYIELMSVELWDGTTTPPTALHQVQPQSAHPTGLTYSQAGWRFWGGMLYLPNRVVDMIEPTTDIIRLWGYAPYPFPTDDNDVIPFGNVHEQALIIRCWQEAIRRLLGNRTLFTQWQTRSNNTDVTPAFLRAEKSQSEEEWRRLSRRIAVLRERP
jgi:hypothetical protein